MQQVRFALEWPNIMVATQPPRLVKNVTNPKSDSIAYGDQIQFCTLNSCKF